MADKRGHFKMNVSTLFDLKDKVALITGGAGLLGIKHAEAIAEMGGIPILIDVCKKGLDTASTTLKSFSHEIFVCDITQKSSLEVVLDEVKKIYGRLDILINNAAINPKVESKNGLEGSRLEYYSLNTFKKEIDVGLTGAFLCSQVFGTFMAERKKGVILNIASDLGLIAPNQSLYKKESVLDEYQPVKPVTYSIIKHGLVGLTRYLATYWAQNGIRCNALAPGGVENGQSQEFINRIEKLIPMGRMAHVDEYKAAIVFMVSDASSYMNGAVLSVDGGRTCW